MSAMCFVVCLACHAAGGDRPKRGQLQMITLLVLLWTVLHCIDSYCYVLLCTAGGDGPKRGLLQQMITQEGLAGRVKLAGAIPHERAREFLVRTLALSVKLCVNCGCGGCALLAS
jgi:hypothetical protein